MNLKLFKNKNLTLLILGKFVSLIGTAMQDFALSLYVLKITGSGSLFASVLAIGLIPKLVFGPIGGVLADWFDRKKIIVYMDLLSGFWIIGLFILSITVGVGLIHIYITVMVLSLISVIFGPAIGTAIPSIIEKEDLMDANSINTFMSGIGYFIAPAIAGFIFGIYGISTVLLVNAISFIGSAISEMFIELPKLYKKHEKLDYSAFKYDLIEGINYIKGSRMMIVTIVSAFAINFACNPVFSLALTYVSKITLKLTDLQYGFLETFCVLGTFVAPVMVSYTSKKFDDNRLFYLGFISLSTFVAAIGVIASPVFLNLFVSSTIPYISLIIIGVLSMTVVTVVNITMMTILQKQIPMEMMGRVSAVFSTLVMLAIPIGQMFFGILLDNFLSFVPLMVGAVVILFSALLYDFNVKKSMKDKELIELADFE